MQTNSFKIELHDIIQTAEIGFHNVGFLFGAGTSLEAGFPVTMELTRQVIGKLSEEDIDVLQKVLDIYQAIRTHDYNLEENLPDIEKILDMLFTIKLHSKVAEDIVAFNLLDNNIKLLIYEILSSIKQPTLAYHIKFLNAIKARIGKNSVPFTVFTTNYDTLFEQAAFYSNVLCENGFIGPCLRYLDIESYNRKRGECVYRRGKANNEFIEQKEPVFKLLKLHGSLSWYKNEDCTILESFTKDFLPDKCSQLMIYPEEVKVEKTMKEPYASLFDQTKNMLGNEVKYLVSCGYSFRDEHINNRLIFPKLRDGSISLFAFFKEEPECINELKKFDNFKYLTQDKIYCNKTEYQNDNQNLWRFSEFVEFLERG